MAERHAAAVRELAGLLGVATTYRDGLGRRVDVATETLLRVCAALDDGVERPVGAVEAVERIRHIRARELVPPVLVAWDGRLEPVEVRDTSGGLDAEVVLDDGSSITLSGNPLRVADRLPWGYHRLDVSTGATSASATIVSAPLESWRRFETTSWGVAAHLGALRSARSRAVGDLVDLRTLCAWVGDRGGDLVTLLPLLPAFNDPPVEPSPYSPVSRLFWNELVLDLGDGHQPATIGAALRIEDADREVRTALASAEVTMPTPDDELARYAAFRGAQRRLGRRWRTWPDQQRRGHLTDADVDPDEARHHLMAQFAVRNQLEDLARDGDIGVQLGLDLAVGVHPDGYDTWSRPELFAKGVIVGAPPDAGFPSGQSWGFPPVLPHRSRLEGHAYVAASIAHQASVAGVLRIDHIMAMSRLYWIPEGSDQAEGTYVEYPTEELFAVLCLESHRNRCEIIGENLGTVPPVIEETMPRHGIRGIYLAEFAATSEGPMTPPTADEMATIGTHDTPLLVGWLTGADIDERVRLVDVVEELMTSLLRWLGESDSPLVSIWFEDLWLESEPVNIPGSTSTDRPNWQRPMARLLEDVLADPAVVSRVEALDSARRSEETDRRPGRTSTRPPAG
jgi:4-alpha-glucanotransferase